MLVDNLWRRRKRPESQLPEKRFGCHFGRAEAEPVAGSRDQVSNKDGVQVTTGKVEMNNIKTVFRIRFILIRIRIRFR